MSTDYDTTACDACDATGPYPPVWPHVAPPHCNRIRHHPGPHRVYNPHTFTILTEWPNPKGRQTYDEFDPTA